MPLAFVGTGRLGSRLVARLLSAGHNVTVYDTLEVAVAGSVALGAVAASSLADAVRDAEVVMTCLPRADIVASLAEGDDGLLTAMAPGSCWIDITTSDSSVARRLAALATERDLHFLEAPVTGGVHLAAEGRLTVLVGGREDIVNQYLPLLRCFGTKVIYLGEVGQASVVKVITNMLAFIHLVAAGEALMLAARAGIDLRDAYEAIRASSGNSFVHETESQVVLSGSYDIGFTIELAVKDLGLVSELSREHGVPLELADLVARRFRVAAERYGGSAWSPKVVQLLEDELHTALRAPGFPQTLEGTEYRA